jgi:glycerol kinase
VPVLVCRSADATALGVAALARLGVGEATSVGEALGPAEVETVVEPSITADQAAERLSVFRSALDLALAPR